MKENKKENKNVGKNRSKFIMVVSIILSILIAIVAVQEKNKAILGNKTQTQKTETVTNEENLTEESTTIDENTTDIAEDIIIGGDVLTGLSDSELVEKCNEVVFSKEFIVDGRTYKATEVAIQNLEDGYIFYNVADIGNEIKSELMLVNVQGDIESNLALSFLTTYYYLNYFNLYGQELDTQFAPIDVEAMGNVYSLTNQNVTYDFKYSYEVDGNTYTFTEVK